LNEDELKRSNIPLDMIRFSVGYENIEDIKEDLKQAFSKYKN